MRLFGSFDEAWDAFLARSEPLESFFAAFPDDPATVKEGWLVEPSAGVVAAARRLQAELAHLDWLEPVPAHFLHVWLAEAGAGRKAPERWRALPQFEVEVRRVAALGAAVVAEVHGPLGALLAPSAVEPTTFLPHLSLAYVRAEHPPDELRAALTPLRDASLGRFVVRETKLVRFPAARSTVLQPWEVVRTIRLAAAR